MGELSLSMNEAIRKCPRYESVVAVLCVNKDDTARLLCSLQIIRRNIMVNVFLCKKLPLSSSNLEYIKYLGSEL